MTLSLKKFVPVALAAALVALAPVPALALTTEKCTAKPNVSGESTVLGATETRITWEAQADEDESVSSIALTLPEGTSFSLDDAKVTVLTGDDLMTRENPEVSFSIDGQTLTADFAEPLVAGAYVRIEVYDVFFPTEGGQMQVTGTATFDDGSTQDIDDAPAIEVSGISATEALSTWLEEQEWVQAWNSNKFLKLFLNPPILVSSFPLVLQGFFMALAIVLVAFPLAIPFGFALALMRISKLRALRAVSSFYVNIVRGTPAFLQIYIAFFGLPLAGVNIASYPLGVIVLAMNSAAYLCEIFRAGIQSIPKGQNEAARSLGMTSSQTMLYIIVPQTFKNVLPTMTSEFILLYKDTSLLAAVGVTEIVMYAKTIVASTGSITPYVVAALFYLVITLPLAKLVSKLEARMLHGDAGARRAKKGAAPAESAPEPELAGVIDGDHII